MKRSYPGIIKMSRCYVCKTQKPADEFYRDTSRSSGVMSRCRKCYKLSWDDWKSKPKRLRPPVPKVVWKRIQRFPKYLVSDWGHIKHEKSDRLLGQRLHRSGYLMTKLYNPATKRNSTFAVHRLVVAEFLPPPATPTQVVDHKNDIKIDNRAQNLKFVSRRQNTQKYYASLTVAKRA